MNTLEVKSRVPSVKGANRKARAAGVVPAVVYGPEKSPVPIGVDPEVLLEIFKETGNRNTIINVKIDATEGLPCLVREVQRHPLSRKILHVDFYALPKGGEVAVTVPLQAEGRPKGALLGGKLRLVRRELKLLCRWDAIPSVLTVDVSHMEINDFIRASGVALPEGCRLAADVDFIVVNVYGKREAPAVAAVPGEKKDAKA